jgi:predicted lipoprotein with Yx(FWY)xxD motif
MTLIDRPLGLARGLALGVAAIVVAAACSGTGASAAPTAAPATQAPVSAPPASAEPSAAASPAAGGALEVKVATGSDGMYLTGADGKTLYIFKNDTTPGKSSCNGDCATKWPPFVVEAGATTKAGAGVTGALATIKRDDGADQVTYNGVPLYYFAADAKAGDTIGQGFGGVWFVANP